MGQRTRTERAHEGPSFKNIRYDRDEQFPDHREIGTVPAGSVHVETRSAQERRTYCASKEDVRFILRI